MGKAHPGLTFKLPAQMMDIAIIEQLTHFRKIVLFVLYKFLDLFDFQFDKVFFDGYSYGNRKNFADF